MSKEKIADILKNLRREIDNADIKDGDLRNQLDTLMENLDLKLNNQDNPEVEEYSENISLIIEQFEIEHPGITELLSKLSMGLSNMGI